ncbi:MAG: class I SAM-dependent methyltransferase [Candidatus Thorarchaeota archaeon]
MKKLDRIQVYLLAKLHNYIYKRISYLSTKLNQGVHPKHRVMDFHSFFVNNIANHSTVLDIGCGNGAVDYDVAEKAKRVVGIDISKNLISFARKKFYRKNIQYIHGDALEYDFDEKFDYIILSNILEHIQDRISFLNRIKELGRIFLIRIPMINRSWLTLYKKELGIEYRLDKSHYIEYTFKSFEKEIKAVGLKILSYSTQFGEIWAVISI